MHGRPNQDYGTIVMIEAHLNVAEVPSTYLRNHI
jgi:hypothetical protein